MSWSSSAVNELPLGAGTREGCSGVGVASAREDGGPSACGRGGTPVPTGNGWHDHWPVSLTIHSLITGDSQPIHSKDDTKKS